MKFIRIPIKLFSLITLAFLAIGVMFVYSLGAKRNNTNLPNTKQKAYRKKWLQKVVKVVGLDVELKGDIAPDNQSALWVSNHISWMDIAVVGSQGVGFLSKKEVRKWPLIGWLGAQSGTVFIDRGGKNAAQVAAKSIAEKILAGDNILVFPEGTTSSGENIKRFHARIFAPALDHQLLVQPIAIQYLDEHGQANQQVVWQDQSFLSNVLGVLGQPRIRVVLTFLPMVDAQQFAERRQLAQNLEIQIRDVVISSQSLKVA